MEKNGPFHSNLHEKRTIIDLWHQNAFIGICVLCPSGSWQKTNMSTKQKKHVQNDRILKHIHETVCFILVISLLFLIIFRPIYLPKTQKYKHVKNALKTILACSGAEIIDFLCFLQFKQVSSLIMWIILWNGPFFHFIQVSNLRTCLN